MTAPLTSDAWTEARELVRQSIKAGAPGLTEASREAVVGSIMLKLTNKVLAPLLAAHQQVTAERNEARAKIDRLSFADETGAVWRPVPGWSYFALHREIATANAELARLQAEGEAKDRALKDLRADAAELGARLGNASQYDDRRVLRDLCWEAGNFLARRVIRSAPARAATAREGA